ncbi:hypothetical protein VTN77DRAFT_502 [Rasamsonia byssochlamydoides]|uniref:uncharacterized protein n=1 Tax=Rasamsonia byssochlamydoides TaxID=89139 RepID=UPI00374407C9
MAQEEEFWAPGVLDACSDVSGFASGHLSLHDYRKFLSQPEDIDLPDELKGRTLRRKPAASNLNPARIRQDSSFSSPLSSPPSSPPPLSFSQSVITLQSENETQCPETPLGRLSTRSPSQAKRLHTFRDRLSQSRPRILPISSHKRASSDTALLGVDQSRTTITYEGISFEIINPRESLDVSNIVSSTHRSSEVSRETTTMTSSSPKRPSTVRSARSILENIPNPTLSVSENSKFPSPSPGLLEADDPFVALPNLIDLPRKTAHQSSVETPTRSTKKAPSHILTQKVSQLFGSSRGKFRRLFSPESKSSDAKSQEILDRPESGTESYMTAGMELSNMGQRSTYLGDIDDQKQSHSSQGCVEMSSTAESNQYQSARSTVEHASSDSFHDAGSREVPEEPQGLEPVSEELVEAALDVTLANGDALVRRRPIPSNAEYRANRYHTVQSALAEESYSILFQDIIGFLQLPSDPDSIQPVESQNHDSVEEVSLSSSAADRDLSGLPGLQQYPSRARSIETQDSLPQPAGPVRESTRASIRPYLQPVAAFMARSSVSSIYSVESEVRGQEETKDEQEWEDVDDDEEPNQEMITEGDPLPPAPFSPFAAAAAVGEPSGSTKQTTESSEQEAYGLPRFMTGSSLANVTSHGSLRQETPTTPETPTPRAPRPAHHPRWAHHRDSLQSHRIRYANMDCPVLVHLPNPDTISRMRAAESPRYYASLQEPGYATFPNGSYTTTFVSAGGSEQRVLSGNTSHRIKNTKKRIKVPCCCQQ